MTRLLAGGFAIVSVLGSALAFWLVVIDDDDGDAQTGRVERLAQASPGEEPARPPGRRFTVSVSGDLLMHSPLLDRALENGGGDRYDFAPFFKPAREFIEGADLALCHMETPMGPGPPSSYPIFNTPKDLAASVHKSGWDACSTASNHSLDQGEAGIAGTSEALDKAGVEHTGSFASERASKKPTILEVGGVKLGYVAYTDATNGLVAPTDWAVNEYSADDPKAGAKAIIADARRARDDGADAVIVNVHWGDENSDQPNDSQITVAKKLTEAKVITAVVGQGPHVVQPIWRMNQKFVVFSEGNLVSNQSPAAGLPAATQDGLIALLRFVARGNRVRVKAVKYAPTWVRPGDYAVLPADPKADPSYAGELRASRSRTIGIAGKGDGIKPIR
jgi:poly-gamma-glutamate capsule biosynthesis protein CapA/YwtB (metallophosphatase superfamily)